MVAALSDRFLGFVAGVKNGSERRRLASQFLPAFDEYCTKGLSQPEHHGMMLSAFIQSQGRLLSEANKLLAGRGRCANDGLPWGGASREYAAYADVVRQRGFCVLRNFLSREEVDAALLRFAALECIPRGDQIDSNTRPCVPDFDAPIAEKYSLLVASLRDDPLVRQLATDQFLQGVAAAYLEGPPILDTVSAWFSFPASFPSSQAGQIFHFDLERIKWIKCFVFLTPATITNGAHVFVPGTHRDGGIPPAVLRRGYTRHSDQRISALVKADPVVIEAKPGDVLLEDTRGLHKGLPLQRDFRAVVELQFTSSLFGGPSSWQSSGTA